MSRQTVKTPVTIQGIRGSFLKLTILKYEDLRQCFLSVRSVACLTGSFSNLVLFIEVGCFVTGRPDSRLPCVNFWSSGLTEVKDFPDLTLEAIDCFCWSGLTIFGRRYWTVRYSWSLLSGSDGERPLDNDRCAMELIGRDRSLLRERRAGVSGVSKWTTGFSWVLEVPGRIRSCEGLSERNRAERIWCALEVVEGEWVRLSVGRGSSSVYIVDTSFGFPLLVGFFLLVVRESFGRLNTSVFLVGSDGGIGRRMRYTDVR